MIACDDDDVDDNLHADRIFWSAKGELHSMDAEKTAGVAVGRTSNEEEEVTTPEERDFKYVDQSLTC